MKALDVGFVIQVVHPLTESQSSPVIRGGTLDTRVFFFFLSLFGR